MIASATWEKEQQYDALSASGHHVVTDADAAHAGDQPNGACFDGLVRLHLGRRSIDSQEEAGTVHRAHGFRGRGSGA